MEPTKVNREMSEVIQQFILKATERHNGAVLKYGELEAIAWAAHSDFSSDPPTGEFHQAFIHAATRFDHNTYGICDYRWSLEMMDALEKVVAEYPTVRIRYDAGRAPANFRA